MRHDQLVEYLRAAGRGVAARALRGSGPQLGRAAAAAADRLLAGEPGADRRHPPAPRRRLRAALLGRRAWTTLPVVVWLGYSIHGNEASGANAALLVAYHLAAANGGAGGDRSPSCSRHTVVLIDPSLNPDGLGRFAQWADMHRGEVPVGDPQSRARRGVARRAHQPLLVRPEPRLAAAAAPGDARPASRTLRRWRPNLLADFHEMGSDGTYFFQPGRAEPPEPAHPGRQPRADAAIARYHADALDARRPAVLHRGDVRRLLLRQGLDLSRTSRARSASCSSRRAPAATSPTPRTGRSPFREAIRGHVLTSLSTLRAAHDLRRDLVAYQASFFRDAIDAARRDPTAAFLVGDGGDPARAWLFLDLLAAHGVEVHELAGEVSLGGTASGPATPGRCRSSSASRRWSRPSSSAASTSPTRPSTTSRRGPCRSPSTCRPPSCRASGAARG